MDIRKIKKLIELLEASELVEMEISEGEESIRLSRGSSQPQMLAPASMSYTAPTTAPAIAPSQSEPSPETDAPIKGHSITSPMVGSYYASSGPEAEPYVSIGSEVSIGDTLCIIEAMKIFNQIEADRAGTIKAILKESGDPVEYGEVLFIID